MAMEAVPTLLENSTGVGMTDHELGPFSQNPLNSGFDGKQNVTRQHPLQGVNIPERERAQWLQQLRKEEGLHLPFKMQMEQNILKKHQRLPCMRSSGVLMESLTGQDLLLPPEDIFNDVYMAEVSGSVHTMIEHSKMY